MEKEFYVIIFNKNYFWKGPDAKITPGIRNATFLRKSDIEGDNLKHILDVAKEKIDYAFYEIKKVKIILED